MRAAWRSASVRETPPAIVSLESATVPRVSWARSARSHAVPDAGTLIVARLVGASMVPPVTPSQEGVSVSQALPATTVDRPVSRDFMGLTVPSCASAPAVPHATE